MSFLFLLGKRLMLYHIAVELAGFEEAWGGNADGRFHGWNDTFDFPGNSGKLRAYLSPVE